jgi:hypothetical protein
MLHSESAKTRIFKMSRALSSGQILIIRQFFALCSESFPEVVTAVMLIAFAVIAEFFSFDPAVMTAAKTRIRKNSQQHRLTPLSIATY